MEWASQREITLSITEKAVSHPIPLVLVHAGNRETIARTLTGFQRQWLSTLGFQALPHTWCAIPREDGTMACVWVGVDETPEAFALGHLPWQLPEGDYALAEAPPGCDVTLLALGFQLGAYQFTRYKAAKRAPARLLPGIGTNAAYLQRAAQAIGLVRDLVNTPSQDMGPGDLSRTAADIAAAHDAQWREWIGEQLLEAGFPAIHAVGRAAAQAPRLIELTWGNPQHPKLALVGKGVCFDTGGLNLKPADGMRWMKKDMGGAAHALALAQWVMASGLPVHLHVLVPAVENAVAGNAMRPGEVLRTRAGISVEVDNTDAEGRLVLCDALTYAAERRPDWIIDFATLTGAARIALGPDLPALFGNHAERIELLLQSSRTTRDPMWQLPLWPGYRSWLDSGVADMANAPSSRHAGAITAALYLERFIPADVPWTHLDVYAWNDGDRPGRPKGGEAYGLRAVYDALVRRYR